MTPYLQRWDKREQRTKPLTREARIICFAEGTCTESFEEWCWENYVNLRKIKLASLGNIQKRQIHKIYQHRDITKMVKSRSTEWTGDVAYVEHKALICLISEPEIKRPLGRPRHRWDNNHDIKSKEWKDMNFSWKRKLKLRNGINEREIRRLWQKDSSKRKIMEEVKGDILW